MKRPFTFLGTYGDAGGFPTLNGTLYDYWQSNAGVATSGGQVTVWTGQANGRTFDQGTTGGPTVSGSNAGFNGVDTLTFNGTDAGLGHTGNEIQGVDTGSIHISIYGAPHPAVHASNWGGVFGCSSDGNTPFITEAVMRGINSSNISLYGYPPGQTNGSDDDTYGKGIYTITMGNPEGFGVANGAKFFNKNSSTQNASVSYSSYDNARQPFMIGAYNALNNADLFGKVDIAGCVIWYNSYGTDFSDDIDAIEAYFQGIYG